MNQCKYFMCKMFFDSGVKILRKELLLLCCAQSCLTLCNPVTVARQAPLSMRFSRQRY